MTRVATMTYNNTIATAMRRSQERLAESQTQLDTEKKVQNYGDLGGDATRVLSASSMLAQQDAQNMVAKRVDTTLGFYDTSLNAIDDSMSTLKTQLLKVIGDGNSGDLGQTIQNAFVDLRNSLNQSEGGVPIFAGAQTDTSPFKPQTLDDLAALTDPNDAFANDGVRNSARLGDNVDVQYGIGASDIGTGLVKAFQTLAGLGDFGEQLTDEQSAGLQTAIAQIEDGLKGVRSVNAQNGDLMNHVDALGQRSADRSKLLTQVVGDAVDADLGQVSLDITSRTTILNASYSVFSQLQNLSLVNFLH
jgi:flagellar hook-associated protein 3 FlgL